MTFEHRKMIKRSMLNNEPNTLFVFGDNMRRTGFGGQAREMRGEHNAVGIPTKYAPRCDTSSYFCDDDLPNIIHIIDGDFDRLRSHAKHGGKIVWPTDGIGTGLAGLTGRAPKIARFIENRKVEVQKLCSEVAENAFIVE